MKQVVIYVRSYTIELFEVRNSQEIYWYVMCPDTTRNGESVLEEGQSSSPQLAVQKAREALYNLTGIRE